MRRAMIRFAKPPHQAEPQSAFRPRLRAIQAAVPHAGSSPRLLRNLCAFNDFADMELRIHTLTDASPEGLVTCKLQYARDLQLKMFHALELAPFNLGSVL